jgi:hypothetical protein
MSTAIFHLPVEFKNSAITGPFFTDIESKNTAVLTALNEHKTQYASDSATVSASLAALAAADSNEASNRANADQSLADAAAAESVRLDAAIAAEVAARQAADSAAANARAVLAADIKTNQDAHVADDARLTAVESALQTVDSDLQAQITAAVNEHNTELGNIPTIVSDLQSKFIIDEVNNTITIPAGYTFVVAGSFQNGSA